ncbi:right-handed parallel beta-helix repeat-containing protein, partial [Rhizobium leguminosarum]
GRDVGDLFVSGARQTQARFPNAPLDGDPRKGWLCAAKCTQDDDLWQGNTRVCVQAGDRAIAKNAEGLVAHSGGGFH